MKEDKLLRTICVWSWFCHGDLVEFGGPENETAKRKRKKKTPANEKVITIAFDSSTFRARQGQIF